MKYILQIGLILILSCTYSYAQIHKDWCQKDKILIDSIIKLKKQSPKDIELFFKRNTFREEKENLGFGWMYIHRAIGAGYISVWADFYYHKDTLKTYILQSKIPEDYELFEEYKMLYSKSLPIDSGNMYYYIYKNENILQPLNEFSSTKYSIPISAEIQNYMSPSSGIIYGFRGGIAMNILQNRKMFIALKNKLTQDQIVSLMYAINPASRLTAIEYYLKNIKQFTTTQEINNWINSVYAELPQILTISGCIQEHANAKSLVEKYVNSKSEL